MGGSHCERNGSLLLRPQMCYKLMTPDANDIMIVKSVLRDLGVTMIDKAKWKDHIDQVCSQVNQKARWVLRTFKCRTTNLKSKCGSHLCSGTLTISPDGSNLYSQGINKK